MRLQCRRFLSCFILVNFASISFLGEGLHLLTPCAERQHHHHHLHGPCVVRHAAHDSQDDDHDAELVQHTHGLASAASNETASPRSQLAVTDTDLDFHLCKICAYLFQAVSEPVAFVAPLKWRPLVIAVPGLHQHIYSHTSLGSQAPRGPPCVNECNRNSRSADALA
jgi:hypothetical protein